MRGKNKCKILKEIRQKIADENDIPYVTRECSYQGECSGTCPRCEAELRYLERELDRRRAMGKAVAVAAIAASLTLTSGCVPGSSGPITEDPATTAGTTASTEEILEGEVEAPGYEEVGIVPAESTEGEPYELEGDVTYNPEDDPLETEVPPVETLPVEPEGAAPTTDAG